MAAASLDETKANAVLRQVEFYFSDSNLPKDKFLRKTVEESEDGLVSLALICSFNRMREHLGLGKLKPEEVPEETVLAVAEVLKKSDVLKVSEDGKKIGRNSELSMPEDIKEQVDSRTIAASPLPYDIRIEDMESFFGQHGKVNSVRLPRLIGDKRQFCGTTLIEYSEEESAKEVLRKNLIYAGAELEIKSKKEFDAERDNKWKEYEKSRPNKDESNGSYPKGLIVSFKLKSIHAEGSREQFESEVIKTDEITNSEENANEAVAEKTSENVTDNEGKSAEDVEKVDKDNAEETDEKAVSGDVKVSGEKKNNVSTNDKNIITREDLKAIFQKFGNVKYIDFTMGEESGYIRFEDPDAAVKARAIAVLNEQGGFIIKNHIATIEALSGDAEKEYWSLLRGSRDKYKENRGGGRGRGRGNRGGRQFDGKRHRESFNGRPNKAQKVGGDE